MKLIILCLLLSLPACSVRHTVPVEIAIPEDHPFETGERNLLWFTLLFFDGESIREMHIPAGERRVAVSVKSGCLAVFSLKALGELGSLGGFHEPGDGGEVIMLPEYGAFSEMLLRAASYRAEPVARLSMSMVLDSGVDLQAVDESSFLADVFSGTLSKGITLNGKESITIDTIPSGEWVSERYDIPSFSVPFSGRPAHFLLYPGVYRYAELERNLLLTIAVMEDGEISSIVSPLPVW